MNIFILDTDIKKCAQAHVDKHVVKMILESAQMLCAAKLLNGEEAPYKLTHKNHPCTKWVRESRANWLWLKHLMHALNEEYKYRFEHEKDHLSWTKLKDLEPPNIEDIGLTKFAQAMPEECKAEDAVEAYRSYYREHKNHIASWKKRNKPEWF